MTVTRKMAIETDEVRVGDQIEVVLKDFGRFTATAQRVTDTDILFLFDEVIDEHPMNKSNTNAGGFEKSDMNLWLHETVLPAFPEKLRCKVIDITLPTFGEIFGHYFDRDFYSMFEPDEDNQFELMKQINNRICNRENINICYWWWLRNAVKQNVSLTYFAYVYSDGNAYYSNASNASIGVRPEFKIIIQS